MLRPYIAYPAAVINDVLYVLPEISCFDTYFVVIVVEPEFATYIYPLASIAIAVG